MVERKQYFGKTGQDTQRDGKFVCKILANQRIITCHPENGAKEQQGLIDGGMVRERSLCKDRLKDFIVEYFTRFHLKDGMVKEMENVQNSVLCMEKITNCRK